MGKAACEWHERGVRAASHAGTYNHAMAGPPKSQFSTTAHTFAELSIVDAYRVMLFMNWSNRHSQPVIGAGPKECLLTLIKGINHFGC